jgi:DNA-binding transcriptional LysR family regulator
MPYLDTPTIDSLLAFAEVARWLSFRAAARALPLTPTALGQRVRQLEERVGRPLFQRTTRRVSLTEAGLALVPAEEAAIAAADGCLRAARGETGPPPQDLVLGTRHELGMSWILPMLPLLAARAPRAHAPRLLRLGPGPLAARALGRGPLRRGLDAPG